MTELETLNAHLERSRRLLESVFDTFKSAYDARKRCGATLEGLMIELDITAAYEGTEPFIRKTFADTLKAAVAAADADVPLKTALAVLHERVAMKFCKELVKMYSRARTTKGKRRR